MTKQGVVLLVMLTLLGCASNKTRPVTPAPTKPAVAVEPVRPTTVAPVPPKSVALPLENVPLLPKFSQPNWPASLGPLLEKMVNTEGIMTGKTLLPGGVSNHTNGSLEMGRATAVLYKVLSSSKKFVLITPDQLIAVKQTLGLSEDDNLGLRSKVIALARYVGAQYVLYTDVSGDVKVPDINMQLMSVQTGEIIWSGSGFVHYD